MILAIDTATAFSGLALWGDNQVWAEETWYSPLTHSVELMPRIQRMLSHQRIGVNDLSCLAVSLGPGSFTGLRVGLAAAKGLALPGRLPLVGISTLDAAAYPFQGCEAPVWALIQAGRGRIGAACYRQVDGVWTQILPPTLTTPAGLSQLVVAPAVVVGEINEQDATNLRAALGTGLTVPSPAVRLRRAAYLAELASVRLERNELDDVNTLAPIYLQTPEGHAIMPGVGNGLQ
jgi:tRNA threonylcarbamoyladenosine biosynthesis protein TsaB